MSDFTDWTDRYRSRFESWDSLPKEEQTYLCVVWLKECGEPFQYLEESTTAGLVLKLFTGDAEKMDMTLQRHIIGDDLRRNLLLKVRDQYQEYCNKKRSEELEEAGCTYQIDSATGEGFYTTPNSGVIYG